MAKLNKTKVCAQIDSEQDDKKADIIPLKVNHTF